MNGNESNYQQLIFLHSMFLLFILAYVVYGHFAVE